MSTSALPAPPLGADPLLEPALGARVHDARSISVAIAHGQRLVRAGLRLLLERESGIVVVEAATGDEAVHVSQSLCPDVVLVDVELPGLGCVETTRRIVAGSTAQVMVLASSDTDPRVFATLVAGAAGVVVEDREPAVLVRAIRRFGRAWRPRRRSRRARPAHDPTSMPDVVDITFRRGGS
jgi:DNA-binding NarL/FixJ family response regulator